MNSGTMLLQGILPPVTTPFYPDGRVYFKKLESNVERYSRTPVTGLVVLGSTGEVVMLSDEERRDVLKAARDAAAPNKVLLAGTGAESVRETLKMTEYAASVGYDLALVRTPHYYRNQMKPANMLNFYRTVADQSPLPVLLYSVPPCTAYDLPAEVIIELAGHPNIVGLKESSGDVEKVRKLVEGTRHIKHTATVTETFEAVTPRMIKAAESRLVQLTGVELPASSSSVSVIGGVKTRKKEVGFQVLVGAAQKLEPSLQAGAVGAVLGFANPAPTACYEIYAAWKEGDHALAREKQERITKAAVRIASEFGIPGIKYSMDFNGYFGGTPRSPLLPLTREQRDEVEVLLASVRN
jgi:dihydrodipicolinate synthase/N-acetylneuraminate lyase